MGSLRFGTCCDSERTSVAWSSFLHSLLSFRMNSSLQRSTESSMLSNPPTSFMELSLVLYTEPFNPSNASFIAIGTFRRSNSAILCKFKLQVIRPSLYKEAFTQTPGGRSRDYQHFRIIRQSFFDANADVKLDLLLLAFCGSPSHLSVLSL